MGLSKLASQFLHHFLSLNYHINILLCCNTNERIVHTVYKYANNKCMKYCIMRCIEVTLNRVLLSLSLSVSLLLHIIFQILEMYYNYCPIN